MEIFVPCMVCECEPPERVTLYRAGYLPLNFCHYHLPFGIPMDSTNMLGLPNIVYLLLESKSKETGMKLDYNISGTGDCMELTLRWCGRGSRWEQPFNDKWKYKSPSTKARDRNRKKWQNVKQTQKKCKYRHSRHM